MPGQGERMESERCLSLMQFYFHPWVFSHVFLSHCPFLFSPISPQLQLGSRWGRQPRAGSGGGGISDGCPALAEILFAFQSAGLEYREGSAAFHSPARKINTLGLSLGRRRVLLLHYYSLKTKQILEPSSASLAWKYIFQSG